MLTIENTPHDLRSIERPSGRNDPAPQTSSGSCGKPAGVVISAGSSGGISALGVVLSSLPADFPLPIVVVQHRSSAQPFRLPGILGRLTVMKVKAAQDGDRLAPGIVYVAPPGRHAVIDPDATLRLVDGRRIKFLWSSANPLFESAARAFGTGVIAVVLSGYGSDGTDGVQAVRRGGGVVIAQDAATAGVFAMPAAAIASGAVDYVLPIEKIGPLVVKLAHARPPLGCGEEERVPSPSRGRAARLAWHSRKTRVSTRTLPAPRRRRPRGHPSASEQPSAPGARPRWPATDRT